MQKNVNLMIINLNLFVIGCVFLQADLGDHNDNTTFRPEDYVPPNMRGPAALRIIEAAHRTHRGLSKNEARARFIADACQLQEPVNAHMFR